MITILFFCKELATITFSGGMGGQASRDLILLLLGNPTCDLLTVDVRREMAEGRREEQYIIAFKNGKKLMAEQLLSSIPQPATITTTFKSRLSLTELSLVSLLYLAAYWGWRNVVTALVSVYNCAANCMDEKGHIPLHYAASNGHLEVVKYFILELNCDPMDKNQYDNTPLHYACSYGYLNIAQYLIREGHCNPSCENKYGWTPLHYMLVTMVTSTLLSISSETNTVTHHVRTMLAIHHFTLLVIMVTSSLLSISSERNTVTHHVRTMVAIHHFTMLVIMVTSTLLSISSERNTVTHHVRTMVALHHFTLLVYVATPTLYNICYQLVK